MSEPFFKTPKVGDRSKLLNPLCIDIMTDMYLWCLDQGLPFLVTETVTTEEEDSALQRVSRSHFERRAFDISVRDWAQTDGDLFIEHFNFKYQDVAAVSKASGKPTLVVDERAQKTDASGKVLRSPHLHVQIHKRFAFTADA